MPSLEKVAINDITKLKQNLQQSDEVQTSEIKRKLLDTIETNQLIQMLNATNKTEKNPIDILNDVGFNIKDITGGLKDNAELYKTIAEAESQKRTEAEDRVQEARSQTIELKEKLIENTINMQFEKYNQVLTEIVKKIEDKKENEKKDPINDTANQIVLRLLNEKVDDITTKKTYNPVQEILMAFETYETFRNKFKPTETEIPSGADRLNLEIIKLKLEDERIKAMEEKKYTLDKEKQETFKYALNTLGTELVDVLGSLASAMSITKTQTIEQKTGIQGVTYKCERCNEIFILPRAVNSAICPYCGGVEEVTDNK